MLKVTSQIASQKRRPLYETMALALDSAQASLAPRLFWLLRVFCVRAKDFRRENGARSRVQSRSRRGFENGHSDSSLTTVQVSWLESTTLHVRHEAIYRQPPLSFLISFQFSFLFIIFIGIMSYSFEVCLACCRSVHFAYWVSLAQGSRIIRFEKTL